MASVLNAFTCPICGISMETVKGYVNHQKLHTNEAHGEYACCVIGCKSKFTKYNSFKSHMLRHHRRSSVSQCETVQGPLKCEKPHCQKQCIDLKDLLDHLKLHVSKKEEVKCPFKGCGKAFSLRSSFTAHISRNHKKAASVHVSAMYLVDSVPSQSFDIAQSPSDVSIDEPEDILDPPDMKGLYMRNLCMFYMKLQAKYLVPSSTIQMIVEQVDSLSDVCHQYTRNQLKGVLQANTRLTESEIKDVLASLNDSSLHASCSPALSTEYLRRQYFQTNFSYVHPQTISLGTDDNRKEQFAQYIPIKETLQALLKDPIVWKECTKHEDDTSAHVLSDVRDGSVYKSNTLFRESGISIKLILYQDAFEVVNPLGSAKKKYKILGVYFTLANLDPFYRSSVENLQLVLLCREEHFKYFGHDKVFSTMLSDIKELETNGLVISGHVVKASVFCIAGDNLGSHNIGGFTENFSTSTYFCRYCLVTRSEFHDFQKGAPPRTVQNYNEAVQQIRSGALTEFRGLKFDSVFNSLTYFHVSQPGLPPCIGHDVFEGVVAYDLAMYIKHFVKVKKFFTYSQLNRRIRQFSYQGSDATSTPSDVSEKGVKIGGQATENWSLLRLLPIIIGEKIAETDDPIWQLTVQLKELVELICAPKISHSQVALLNVLIVEYLETRKEMFPDHKLKPKHHYMGHYPALILKFGPLIRLWTMRFESKHSYFKRCVRRTQNFKNVCQTLANNHQLLQTYLNSSSVFAPTLQVKQSTPFHAELYSDAVRSAVEASLPDQCALEASTEIQWKGTLYRKGFFLCIGPGMPTEFAQIELMLIMDKNVHFLVTPHGSQYLPEFGLYEIHTACGGMMCINGELLLDYYPLPTYAFCGTRVISLKHSKVDIE